MPIRSLSLSNARRAEQVLALQRASYRIEAELIGYDAIPPLIETLAALQQCGEIFYGYWQGEELAEIYAAADVFVFPSKTDTFGLVLLEALASGLPVAAFPVKGPRDVLGDAPVGVLDEDLRTACLSALETSPQACVEFASNHTWEASARSFVDTIRQVGAVLPANEPVAASEPDPEPARCVA